MIKSDQMTSNFNCFFFFRLFTNFQVNIKTAHGYVNFSFGVDNSLSVSKLLFKRC